MFGAAGDVAGHAAEDDGVERGDRRPVRVPGQAAREEDGALAVRGCRRRRPARRASPARPGRAAASRRAAAAAARARSPRPARSPAPRRPAGGAGRAGPGAARRRRPAGPASPAPPRRAGTSTSRSRRRSPRSPATARSAARVDRPLPDVGVEPCRRPSPGRSAAGRGAARPAPAGVSTSGSPRRRRGPGAGPAATASSKPVRPSGGSGTYAGDVVLGATASWIRLSTSGRAMALGTGVTRPTQSADSAGVSGRTGTIDARRSPATRGVPLHHLAVGERRPGRRCRRRG